MAVPLWQYAAKTISAFLIFAVLVLRVNDSSLHKLKTVKFFTAQGATHMHSADYAVARCPSVRLSVCHTLVLCLNGFTYPQSFFTIG